MSLSLNSRLLLAASLILVIFFGVTGMVLERAYRQSLERAVHDRLRAQVMALIAAIEQRDDGSVFLANALAETRFFTPHSGLYGQVRRNDGSDVWLSVSLSGRQLDNVVTLARGQQRFTTDGVDGAPVFVFSTGVSWDEAAVTGRGYTFSVAESRLGFTQQMAQYRHLLWGWLVALALLLLIIQAVLLRWALAPVRRVAVDLAQIEAGRETALSGDYPRELQGLTGNLNALLATLQRQMQRYRNALADLAHSLKTPLALLQGSLKQREAQTQMAEQIERMAQVIDYHLQRAAAAGRSTLATPVDITALGRKVMAALDKVYHGKNVSGECIVAAGLRLQADEQDMMEILGNLLDNAYKYCHQRVRLSAAVYHDGDKRGIELCVEDDGSGIDETMHRQVLRRGERAATECEGQGIGLAVVQQIVEAYNGELSFGHSQWQGARVCVRFPGQ